MQPSVHATQYGAVDFHTTQLNLTLVLAALGSYCGQTPLVLSVTVVLHLHGRDPST